MNIKELRKLSVESLKEEIFHLGREQFNLKLQHATRQMTTTHRLKAVRRKLAKSLTILNETIGQKV
jgi:large subunit ribosomal protein L29